MREGGIVGKLTIEWGVIAIDIDSEVHDVISWHICSDVVEINLAAKRLVCSQLYAPCVAVIAETEFSVVFISIFP